MGLVGLDGSERETEAWLSPLRRQQVPMTKLYPRAFRKKYDGLFLRRIGSPKLNRQRYVLRLIFPPALFLLSGSNLLGNDRPATERVTQKINTLVERFRQDLSIKEEVFVSIVPKNDRLVSVERWKNVS